MSFLSVPPESLMQYVKKMKVRVCNTELIHTILPPPPKTVLLLSLELIKHPATVRLTLAHAITVTVQTFHFHLCYKSI